MDIRKEIQDIKNELDINQQEYKLRQDKLLKRMQEIREFCPHDSTRPFVENGEPASICLDCNKIITKEW